MMTNLTVQAHQYRALLNWNAECWDRPTDKGELAQWSRAAEHAASLSTVEG